MLVKFEDTSGRALYINTDHVVAFAEHNDNTTTLVDLTGTESRLIPLNVDIVAMKLGLEPKHEPGFIPLNLSIAELDLPVRAYNILNRYGIHTVGELMNETWSEVADMRNMGNVSMNAIYESLKDLGLELPGTPHWRP